LSPVEVGIPESSILVFATEGMKVKAPVPISLQDAFITGQDLNFLSTKVKRVDLQVACRRLPMASSKQTSALSLQFRGHEG
jgi:hypothetical protein